MTADLRNALLIHNPNAGSGGNARRKQLDDARKMLAAGGIEADLAETRKSQIAPAKKAGNW